MLRISEFICSYESPLTKVGSDEGPVAGKGNATPSVVESLIERQLGANSGSGAYRPKEIGNRGKCWMTTLNGKNISYLFCIDALLHMHS